VKHILISILTLLALSVHYSEQPRTNELKIRYKIGGSSVLQRINQSPVFNTYFCRYSDRSLFVRDGDNRQNQSVVSPTVQPRQGVRDVIARDEGMRLCRKVWTEDECQSLDYIILRESGWQVGILNAEGCGGLGQACPVTKMGSLYGTLEGELNWTQQYITGRYGTAQKAKEFKEINGYY
jgi:hypothetical protein